MPASKSFLVLVLTLLSHFSLAQDVKENSVVPQFTDQKIDKIPQRQDDIETEKLLKEVSKKAGWFPEITIKVAHGIVLIEGQAKNQQQLQWLAQTADKLPTVIAVVNKAKIIEPPITDMSPFFKELKSIANMIKKNLPRVVVGVFMGAFFIFLGLRIQGFSRNIWAKRVPNIFLSSTISKLLMIPVWVILFYLTLLTVGMQSLATTIIGGTGVLGIVFGFAFKGIAENYLSGILLAIRSPFSKGDSVKIGESEGLVQNLNMRGTTLMDSDGNLVLIPNTTVIQSVVRNKTINTDKRITFVLGVSYCDSIKKCQDLVAEALRSISEIKQEPAPTITVENLGNSTVNLRVYFWFNTKTASDIHIKSAAIIKSKEMLMSNGVTLPDESREVVFADTLKIQMLNSISEVKADQEEQKEKVKATAAVNLEEAHDIEVEATDEHEEFMKASENVVIKPANEERNFLKNF